MSRLGAKRASPKMRGADAIETSRSITGRLSADQLPHRVLSNCETRERLKRMPGRPVTEPLNGSFNGPSNERSNNRSIVRCSLNAL